MSNRLGSSAFVAATALLLTAALGFGYAKHRYQLFLKKDPIYPADGRLLSRLPVETRSWKRIGSDRRESPEAEEVLATTNYVSRLYVLKDSPDPANPVVIDFHCAYYTGMIDTVPHVIERCFVGGGMMLGSVADDLPFPLDASAWQPADDVPENLRAHVFRMRLPNDSERAGSYVHLPRDPGQIRLRTMQFLANKSRPLYGGYFFIANGGTVSRAEGVRLLAFDLKTRYAYYCKVQFTSGSVQSGEELARYSASLLDEMLGELMLCLPDWVEVEAGRYPPQHGAGATPIKD